MNKICNCNNTYTCLMHRPDYNYCDPNFNEVIKQKKAVVLGAGGFIGAAVSKKMLNMGADVWTIDNFSTLLRTCFQVKGKYTLSILYHK